MFYLVIIKDHKLLLLQEPAAAPTSHAMQFEWIQKEFPFYLKNLIEIYKESSS